MDQKSPIGLRPVNPIFPITSKFGEERNKLASRLGLKSDKHKGIDFGSFRDSRGRIAQPIEGKEVRAYRDGRCVVCHDNNDGFGLRLVIEHDQFTDLYCHLKEVFISKGDTVKQGDVIALVGNSGKSTSPHLHFETRLKGLSIEPLFYEETV